MKTQFFLIISILFFTSCGKTYQCPKDSLITTYISYTDSEIDTIILRRFKFGSNYGTRIDSTILTASNCQFHKVSDTVTLFPIDENIRINDDYDWQVFNPFDQKTVSISNIKFQMQETKRGGLFRMDPANCVSYIISYNRDNTIVNSIGSDSLLYLFIHK